MSDLNKDVAQLVGELREKTEKYGADHAEVKTLIENHGELLEKQETESQKAAAKLAEVENKNLELSEQVESLEKSVARKGVAGVNGYKESAEYKALCLYASKGFDALDMDQKSLLRSDSDTAGGYLTTQEFDNEIIRQITEISPVRQVARVRTIGKKTIEMPKRTGILQATYEGETSPAQNDISAYGSETLTASALTVNVPLTYDMMLSSDFDIESEVAQDVAESFNQAEGRNFILGDGSNKPEGILAHPDIIAGARETETSGTITGDDILLMTGDLKEGYNPMFGFNRQTLAFLRTLKGSDGQYLWQVGLGPDAPNTIAGESYMVMQDVPGIAQGALSVIYGDFMRGYNIVDRKGLVVVRDEVTRKKERIVELCFHKYNTGQVTLAEAFQVLKIKAQ